MAGERRICIFTGSRAEYSALFNFIRLASESPEVDLSLMVAASHWSPQLGSTYRDILEDGFRISSKVEMVLSSDSSVGIVKSMGVGLISFAGELDRIRPDFLVVAGDRYETLAVVQAAYVMRIPVAHVGGGEVTGGSLDEGFRHAITKLAKVHFVANNEYARRVQQLGEPPESVFVVGPPALEDILRMHPDPIEEISRSVGLTLAERGFILCTYHASGLPAEELDAVHEILHALERHPSLQVVFTSSNADAVGRELTTRIQEWCQMHSNRAAFVSNLGRRAYHSLLQHTAFVMGNSSSGLIEAPAAGVPTVNIGDRQSGRIRERSVIQCFPDSMSIDSAIRTALSSRMQDMAAECRAAMNPRPTAQLMLRALRKMSIDTLGPKQFTDQVMEK